jgi:CRISPR-associated protein Csx10
MKAVRCRISLLEPTIATALEGDANSAVSHQYLPGSLIRGIAVGRYLAAHNIAELDLKNLNHRRLFFDGATRFLNAYPLANQTRTLPVPQSWRTTKEKPAEARDFALEEGDPDTQWKAIEYPFIYLENGTADIAYGVTPLRITSIHTARTRRYGRAMPPDQIQDGPGQRPGAVFRYVALAEGQTFETVVLCGKDDDAPQIQKLLTGTVTIGRARSSGYGKATAESTILDHQWEETGSQAAGPAKEPLVITLLSHALVRNSQGQFTADPAVITHHISQRLGVTLELDSDKLNSAFVQGIVIGGFNRKWGLPLPQTMSAGMGSVLVYKPVSILPHQLQQLLAQGIGERREDGFGRVAVNWQRKDTLRLEEHRMVAAPGITLTQESDAYKMALLMSERLRRQKLDERLVSAASVVPIGRPLPASAQLSRVRTVIHNALMYPEPATNLVRKFIQTLRDRAVARDQFTRSRVGNQSLLDWIDHHISEDNAEVQSVFSGTTPGLAIGGVEAPASQAMLAEFALRYVDAVLARAVKQAQGQEGES